MNKVCILSIIVCLTIFTTSNHILFLFYFIQIHSLSLYFFLVITNRMDNITESHCKSHLIISLFHSLWLLLLYWHYLVDNIGKAPLMKRKFLVRLDSFIDSFFFFTLVSEHQFGGSTSMNRLFFFSSRNKSPSSFIHSLWWSKPFQVQWHFFLNLVKLYLNRQLWHDFFFWWAAALRQFIDA